MTLWREGEEVETLYAAIIADEDDDAITDYAVSIIAGWDDDWTAAA